MSYQESHLENVTELLGYLTRGQCFNADGYTLKDGMRDTPRRFLESWRNELCAGYDVTDKDIEKMLTTFDGEEYDEIILQRNIIFHSLCEHHCLPFSGIAHVGYIPNGPVVGLSKLSRLVDVYSSRFQMQERITTQITDSLNQHLKPKGAACILISNHQCVASRGVYKQGAEMITSSMTGVFRDKPEAREEFLDLIKL